MSSDPAIIKLIRKRLKLDMRESTVGTRQSPTVHQILGCATFLTVFLGGGVYYTYVTNTTLGAPGSGKFWGYSAFMDCSTDEKTNWYSKMNEDQLQEEEYRSRITRYQDMCAVRKKWVSSKSTVFFYKNIATNRSFSYCAVPKTGCTFWQRILQFLNAPSKSNISSLSDVTRHHVHDHTFAKISEIEYNLDIMADAERFFFARDPYARLISAYVDKILLPGFLTWGLFGKMFAKTQTKNSTDKPCVKEAVSFSAFILQIVPIWNLHWNPIHTVCDPCKLFPRFIGKQESFSKDAKYILNKVGLKHLLSKYSHKTYVGDQIKQMIELMYSFRDSDQYLRKCFNNTNIASRLWRAFQINGYLFSSTMFPEAQMERLLNHKQNTSSVVDIVTDVIVRENARAGMSRDQHAKQKRNMVVQEFATLTKDTMEKLADKYDIDFRMFGYEKYPKDLFPWRYMTSQ